MRGKREYDIVMPPRLHESKLWICGLTYKVKTYARAGIRLGVGIVGKIITLVLRPLSDVDDDTLASLDGMTLKELDYMEKEQ